MKRRKLEEEGGPFSNTSSSNGGGYQFDVFLSFRGPDTRQGFTSHLYEALKRFGAITFIDNEDLPKGEEIKHLLHYMEKSQIFVPILSQNYGQSKWCLWEAAKMVEIRDRQKWRTIIPVFYRIHPCDVKDNGGLYQSAIMKLQDEGKLEVEEMKKCIDALKTIGSISGFSLKVGTDGTEAELVTRICEQVQMLLRRVPFGVRPIGIDSQIGKVITMLEAQRNGVCIIGICGMGGIGKTTIAKAIYDKLFCKFDCSINFIEDIGEKESKIRNHIQGKISTNTLDECCNSIRERLRGKRVLIILDNIVKLDQLKKLLGDPTCQRPEDLFGTGSKIIVTTRNKDVLFSYGIKERQIYCPQELKPPSPLQLFCRHAFNAFNEEQPPCELVKLAEEAAHIAGGLPLVLEIFGSAFASVSTTEEWNDKLEKLRMCQPNDIWEKLRLSYDWLDAQQKCAFLDIACLLVGHKRKYVDYLWTASRDTINVLQQRSLISIDDDGRFRVHEKIQEMGRMIASSEGNPNLCMNRLCCTDEKWIVKMDSKEKERVEGIILNMEEGSTKTHMSTKEFQAMSKLRVLHLNFVNFQECEIDHFPNMLNWLCWRGCGLESVTFNDISFGNLTIIDLSRSNIHRLHFENKLGRLKVLDLSHCCFMAATPDFDCTPKLEKLFLDDCISLKEVHESICHLKNLTNWSMRNCESLEKLPQKHLGDLPKLVELNLQGCQLLQSLPRLPSSLRKLFLQECKMLIVAYGIKNLESIELLEMDGCERIYPTLMTKLFQGKSFTRLEELSISGVREGAEFFFLVPLCSSDRPLLLKHLQIYGDSGSPSIVYIKVCIKDVDENLLVYESILSASRDMDNETDDGSCYSLPLSAYDDLNLSLGISTPCSVWVSGIADFPLKRVDITLRSVNKWGGNDSKAIPADENFTNLVEATDSRCGRFTLWYDVFLIYTEEDVDTYFIDNLYKALEEHCTCVFKAKEGERGRGKGEIQLKCIERSLICMPIISKRISKSKWLLDSIAKMVKCGKLIMPVYFQVWPSDIKALTVTEDFGTYLYSYENENRREVVEDWKKALVVVEGSHHHFFCHTNWYMHELTSRICDRISSMLKFNISRFRIPPTWVCSRGKQVEMIFRDLEKETDSVCRIGICGPNGIGKTTIAKIIYNTLFHKFEFGGFITDVGPTIRTSKGLMSLQQKLLSVVAQDDNACIQTADHGKDLIKQRLGHKKVLIVFDNVDELDDWESQYIFSSDLFGGGSKIIVIKKAIEKPDLRTSLDAIYYVDKLTDKKPFQLFAWHAFEGRQPTLELLELAREATKFAEGVPLCLAVLGSLFSSMTTKSEWGSILEKLAAAPGNECIDKIVKVSIDTLNIEQRQVLFDIACLKKHTTSVWKQHRYSPNNIIKFLQERCLVSLDSENRPMMHDAIQGSSGAWLAQEVYNRPRPKSIGGLILTRQNPHLRNVFLDIACCLVGYEKEYATYVWEDMGYSPNNAIKYLQDMSLISIDSEGRLQMDGLVQNVGRLMAKEGEHNPYMYFTLWNGRGLSDPLQEARRLQNMELRWLQVNYDVDEWLWADATSSFEKLLVLQLHYCRIWIRRRLGQSNKVFKKLKVLELLIPDVDLIGSFDFSCMPSLVKLVIEDYYILKTEDLVKDLVMRIGELANLKYLAIRNCYGLEKLCGMIGKLSSLQTLDLRECQNLSELPKKLGDLIALQELVLHNCKSLTEIPKSIIKLNRLQTLDVSDCRSLEHMPQLPSHLIILDASSCWNLRMIADISNLQDLKTLKLHGCTKLRNVPGLQNLTSLQSMRLPFEMACREEEIYSDFDG